MHTLTPNSFQVNLITFVFPVLNSNLTLATKKMIPLEAYLGKKTSSVRYILSTMYFPYFTCIVPRKCTINVDVDSKKCTSFDISQC